MPRRHISQREAHALARRVRVPERRLVSLQYPYQGREGYLAHTEALPVSAQYRIALQAAELRATLETACYPICVVRLMLDGLVVYLFRGDDV